MSTFTRLTGSELFFTVAERLIESAKSRTPEVFARRIIEMYNLVSTERASIAPLNLIRLTAQWFLDKGIEELDNYVSSIVKQYDEALWRAAEVASRRILSGDKILTNSNSIAVRRLLKLLRDQGKKVEVYITESRPGKEGLLISEYAEQLGFQVYLIVDSAVRFFIKDIDKVIVGAEGIAANGAVISKIGTGLIALVAKEARKRVFVVAPSMKFSYETIYGELLKLPEGGAELLIESDRGETPPEGFTARAPLYEVIPPEYIDGIATEYGLIAPQAVPLLLRNIYGEYPPVVKPVSQLIDTIKEKYRVM